MFNIDDAEIGVNLPPLHPFCCSVIVPAYENENRAGRTRWARNPVTGKERKFLPICLMMNGIRNMFQEMA